MVDQVNRIYLRTPWGVGVLGATHPSAAIVQIAGGQQMNVALGEMGHGPGHLRGKDGWQGDGAGAPEPHSGSHATQPIVESSRYADRYFRLHQQGEYRATRPA